MMSDIRVEEIEQSVGHIATLAARIRHHITFSQDATVYDADMLKSAVSYLNMYMCTIQEWRDTRAPVYDVKNGTVIREWRFDEND